MSAAVTRYEARRICPRCPARQVIRISFVTAEPWSIDYECSNCGERWHDDLQSVNDGWARPGAVPHARGFDFPATGRATKEERSNASDPRYRPADRPA